MHKGSCAKNTNAEFGNNTKNCSTLAVANIWQNSSTYLTLLLRRKMHFVDKNNGNWIWSEKYEFGFRQPCDDEKFIVSDMKILKHPKRWTIHIVNLDLEFSIRFSIFEKNNSLVFFAHGFERQKYGCWIRKQHKKLL